MKFIINYKSSYNKEYKLDRKHVEYLIDILEDPYIDFTEEYKKRAALIVNALYELVYVKCN